jgi:hypothetical protein
MNFIFIMIAKSLLKFEKAFRKPECLFYLQ